MTKKLKSQLLVVLLALTASAWAEQLPLQCAPVFGNGAIVQQGIRIPIWGTTTPGAEVMVGYDQTSTTGIADKDGNWRVELDPLKATPLTDLHARPDSHSLDVTATHAGKTTTLSFTDVVVGEVWLCSGQSNMAGKVRHNPLEDPTDNLLHSNFPAIRHTGGDGAWATATEGLVNNFTRVGFCFARELFKELKVPVGLVHPSVGGSSIESWMRAKPDSIPEVMKRGRPVTYGKHYNTMIAPLIGYGMRGAIWYQGEANANEGDEYRLKMEAMIADWRHSWQLGDFPFYYVQIAAIGASPTDNPAMGDGRARIREAQRRVLAFPNVGMATAIDNGGTKEHPQNKKEVGMHLALWALNRTYHQAAVVPSGPLFLSHTVEGNRIRIKFEHSVGLMKATREPFHKPQPTPDSPLPWLSIQGADDAWHWADATIDGPDLIVSSPKVEKPKAVRYAYTNRPVGVYLYNAAGLPASPFTTEPAVAH